MESIETRCSADGARAVLAAWTGFARTRFLQRAIARTPLRVKAREIRCIDSVSGCRRQITGSCYFLLSFREAHDFAGDSGR